MAALIPGGLAGPGLDTGGFYAMSPLENSIRLWAGLNALITPSSTAGETYTELFTQLTSAAGDGQSVHSTTLSSWRGKTSQAAKNKFGHYTGWLHTHAGNAQTAAGHMSAISAAQGTALATMPPPHVVVPAWVKLMSATVAATNPAVMANPASAVAATATLAESEAEWNALRIQAGSSMTTYDTTTAPILAALPPLAQPPSTVNGSAPGPAGSGLFSSGGAAPVSGGGGLPGGGGGGGVPGPGTPGTGSPAPVGAPTAGAPTSGGGSAPGGSLPSASLPTNPGRPGLPTPPLPDGVDRLDATYPGTSGNSAALAALAGGLGMGGLGIGMFSGGTAEVAGEATGFRLPPNWPENTAARTAAEVAAEEEAATAPRGAVAPSAGRRRDDEEERQRGSVPINRPEEIDGDFAAPGVIEYLDDEP